MGSFYPIAQEQLHGGVRERETLLGYAVLKLTAGGDTGYVLDLMTRPGRDDAARALLKGAIEHFE